MDFLSLPFQLGKSFLSISVRLLVFIVYRGQGYINKSATPFAKKWPFFKADFWCFPRTCSLQKLYAVAEESLIYTMNTKSIPA